MANLSEYMVQGEATGLPGVSEETLHSWDRAGPVKARRRPISGNRLSMMGDLNELPMRVRGSESNSEAAVRRRSRRKRPR